MNQLSQLGPDQQAGNSCRDLCTGVDMLSLMSRIDLLPLEAPLLMQTTLPSLQLLHPESLY